MEALLHALQLCIAIACTQDQMVSRHCRQQPDKHSGMRQCCKSQEVCCMADTACSRCIHILGVCSTAVLLWAPMHETCIAEAALLLPEARIERVKQDTACVT